MTVITLDFTFPKQGDRFWSSCENKTKLKILTQKQIEKKRFSEQKKCALPYESCKSLEELTNWIEEADARIVPYALGSSQQGVKRVIMISNDSDTVALLFRALLEKS